MTMTTIGIDASKAELMVGNQGRTSRIRNEPARLGVWAQALDKDTRVGVEATGRYHRPVLKALHEAGVVSYLLNPMHVSRYIKALKPKVKTDRTDAIFIARYLEREHDLLVPYKMPSPEIQELKDLLSFRETLIEKRVALRQSLAEQSFRLASQVQLDQAFKSSLAEVDARIKALAKSQPLYKRLLVIDGVGPLGAAALTWLFASHEFVSSDQAVAFVGLDVSVRQSGKYVGKSKLTKRGPGFIRTFLHNGANSLRNLEDLKPLFDHHAGKGLAPTAVNNIVARKLVRIAYALSTRTEACYQRKNLLPQLT
jgi:transposase